ncbi:hypothetical protein MJI20_30130, partial [Salmonella enterica subsp. enterica serovar Anatum]|nr:hypothetical protein [Salmonella enterica subsp. enterica serovar Anatum]
LIKLMERQKGVSRDDIQTASSRPTLTPHEPDGTYATNRHTRRVACLIYHHKHHLPMAHDSIGNAVFYIANCFANQRKSMAIAKA